MLITQNQERQEQDYCVQDQRPCQEMEEITYYPEIKLNQWVISPLLLL